MRAVFVNVIDSKMRCQDRPAGARSVAATGGKGGWAHPDDLTHACPCAVFRAPPKPARGVFPARSRNSERSPVRKGYACLAVDFLSRTVTSGLEIDSPGAVPVTFTKLSLDILHNGFL